MAVRKRCKCNDIVVVWLSRPSDKQIFSSDIKLDLLPDQPCVQKLPDCHIVNYCFQEYSIYEFCSIMFVFKGLKPANNYNLLIICEVTANFL